MSTYGYAYINEEDLREEKKTFKKLDIDDRNIFIPNYSRGLKI